MSSSGTTPTKPEEEKPNEDSGSSSGSSSNDAPTQSVGIARRVTEKVLEDAIHTTEEADPDDDVLKWQTEN